jgi:dTDP-4-dehydrorhamnose reductase
MLDFLIIGKNGQLASELSDLLKQKHVSFKSFSRTDLDISDHSAVHKKIKKLKPKIIINTSAYHVLADCEKFPIKAFEINSVAVGNLAIVSKEIGAKFITFSTNYVFDGIKKSKYLENDKVNPLQIYGLSKLAGEFDCLSKYPEEAFVVRTCGLYGKGEKGSPDKKGNFVLKVISEAKTTGIIKASTKELANPTYALDLAQGLLKLVNSNAEPGIYHLINEGKISWYDFAKLIVKHKKLKAKVLVDNNNYGKYKRPLNSTLVNKKAKKLGIYLPPIESGLERYLNEF